ncbi:unnamed protein product [Linum tenue]|uniref:F-box domain-containing protein n=1 Tax=Linum tenue TaxID=586396 RepID=A0AAV0LYG0_9ROSI|nr:unnamed protein product [Linum tenue]
METKKTRKISSTEPGIEADDRLSSLPDEVISHILSFLQTKYAVGIAVLRRRWKDLWTRVSNLDPEWVGNLIRNGPLSGKWRKPLPKSRGQSRESTPTTGSASYPMKSSPTFSRSCKPSTPSEPPSSAAGGRITGLGFPTSISTTTWFTSL